MTVGIAVLTLVALLGVAQCAWSQEITASIVGTITDPSGAPIVGASVTAKDTDRGVEYPTKTNATGAYNLTRIPVGSYELRIGAQGFQTAVHPPFTLVLNQTARVDVQLKMGQVSQTVEVTGSAPILQTETTQIDTVLDATTNERLPLATRNYVQLTLLAPGAVTTAPDSFNTGDNTGSGGRPYINGNREQANNFILDGIDNNQVSDNLLGYTPVPDAIQEFNLITQNASAEFGNFQGGIVSTSIKSGTNSFHGDIWEYFRNDKLNANSWEHNFNGPANALPKQKLRWNMFGGTVGGPVVKNKLFFFFDYQMQRFDHPSSTSFINVFTAAERAGDFGDLCPAGFNASGACTGAPKSGNLQLYNPCTNNALPCAFNTGTRQIFPFNKIPAAMLDPVAQALFSSSLYPAAQGTGRQNNATNTTTQNINTKQFDIKIDFVATAKDRVFGRYSHAHQSNPSTNSVVLFGVGFSEAPINSEVVDWSHTFSNSLLNDVRVGVNYVKLNNGTTFPTSVGSLGQQLGIANANNHGPGLLLLGFNGGTPSNVGGGILNSVGAEDNEQNFRDAVIQFSDSAIITRGHHILHTGFEYWRYRINTYYAGNSGKFGAILFNGNFTSNNPVTSDGASGYGGADFFLGLPNSYGQGISGGGWGQRSTTFAGYIQDDWRATNNLTVNLGLRYEAHTPWVEARDRQVNFGLFSGQLLAPNCSLIPSTVPFPCQKSSRGLYNGTYGAKDLQPRIGFAWTPGALGGKTVLRGAFSISSYLEGTGTNLRLPINPPFSPAETLRQFDGTSLPTSTEQGIVIPNSGGGDPYAGALIRIWDPNVQPAITDQWSANVQHQFSNTTTLQVGYVGQHGTHLMVPMPYLQRQLLPNSACATPPCTAPSLFVAGNPKLQTELSQISGTASVGSMKYNALQSVFQKRYSNGLQYQVAYTLSQCRTDNSGYYGSWGALASPANPYYQNLYNPKADWADCYYDSKNVISAFAVYELPYGKGRKFGGNAPGVVNAVAGGWSINPIVSLHGGFPIALYDFGNDPTGTGSRGLRPDCGAGAGRTFGRRKAFDPTSGAFIGYQWFDPSPYSAPAVGTFGNCPAQGPVRGPGYADIDLSLQKNFQFTERFRLQFRGDFLNAFNHVNLNTPGASLGGGMGLINSSQSPRNIQFALKLYY
jgi:hypothetical protein